MTCHNCLGHGCLLYTFPFEGNGNCFGGSIDDLVLACYTLSRLKGMETVGLDVHFAEAAFGLLYTFPFEGNGNPVIEMSPCSFRETLLYTFPFEGNGNATPVSSTEKVAILLYTFPFEGNGNSNERLGLSGLCTLAIHFPV